VPTSLYPFLPDLATAVVVLPLTLLYAAAAAAFTGWLRTRRGVRVAYTRKTFHVLIISAATLIQLGWGLGATVVYGSTVALVVVAAVLRGDGFAFYESLARPADAPRRSLLIIAPLITTAIGGVLANLLFPAWAYVGYAAVAWGDAIGEPVGARWGRHRYTVPSIGGVSATRSLEGSVAVLAATAAACVIALLAAGIDAPAAFGAALFIGVVTTVVEAVSHHGLDNLTIQLAATGAAALLLG
jgi:phytol kinase